LAKRETVNPKRRASARLLRRASGNLGWLERLWPEEIPRWLHQLDVRPDDEALNQVFWLVASAGKDAKEQDRVAALLRPYLNRSDAWNRRLAGWVGGLDTWTSSDAVAIYEELFFTLDDGFFRYRLRDLAKQRPLDACRILKRLLAVFLDRMRDALPSRQTNRYEDIFSEIYEKSTGGQKVDEEVLEELAERVPGELLDAVWKFTVGALPLGRFAGADEDGFGFPSDACRDAWDIRNSSGTMMRHHFGFSLAKAWGTALKKLS